MANEQLKIDRRNISSIETFFDGLLRGSEKLTNNLFFGELPPSIGKTWEEVVIVDCANPLSDMDAYGRMTALVYLYTKPNAYGLKDVKKMQELETKLNALIVNNADEHYHVSIRGRYSNYNAVNDIFVTIVQINLIIT